MAPVLTTHHNLVFIQSLISDIREAISEDRFLSFKRDFLGRFQEGSAEEG
jgi:queuine tRNA-ribosyltransferase